MEEVSVYKLCWAGRNVEMGNSIWKSLEYWIWGWKSVYTGVMVQCLGIEERLVYD